MNVQMILDEIEERIDNARNWDNHEVEFALVNLYEWIKENNKKSKPYIDIQFHNDGTWTAKKNK